MIFSDEARDGGGNCDENNLRLLLTNTCELTLRCWLKRWWMIWFQTILGIGNITSPRISCRIFLLRKTRKSNCNSGQWWLSEMSDMTKTAPFSLQLTMKTSASLCCLINMSMPPNHLHRHQLPLLPPPLRGLRFLHLILIPGVHHRHHFSHRPSPRCRKPVTSLGGWILACRSYVRRLTQWSPPVKVLRPAKGQLGQSHL